MTILTKSFGYPKIGENRELKKALEAYWSGKISKEEFFNQVEKVNELRLKAQKDANINFIASNDFSLYDFILDTTLMFGIIPERFQNLEDSTDIYFSMARGNDNAVACEMTKWFDTNYHYIVPEINGKLELRKNRPLESYKWAKEKLRIETMPSMVGPFTFLKLSKGFDSVLFSTLLVDLADLYNILLKELEMNGVKTVQIDEPALVLDLNSNEINDLIYAYNIMTKDINLDIHVQTYYESLSNYEAKIIQIDEAAFREGMPLKKAKQKNYLDWAVNAFKLSNEDVNPETQIHTHMCYSEFNEILSSIYSMDSDVISIEASRSKGEIIEVFEKLNYDHQIGLGVYDIHSPRIPSVDEMDEIIRRSIKVVDKDLFWINPDCGLKTRGYEETIPALKNMVSAAKNAREKYKTAILN